MSKIVFIGAGSGFGAISFTDIMSFPDLQDSEVVLVDINPKHLAPVEAFCRKVVDHYQAPTRVSCASDWRGGVLDGADYVITSFAQGGPAYDGVPYHWEVSVPQKYGIHQNVADTVGIGGVFRTMRTGGELLAIAQDMEQRCPGSYLLNYVNPMSMLTRILTVASPKVNTIGLCHNIQYGIRDIARWLGVNYKQLRYLAAGINHMDWFLRLEYLDGRSAYPDLLKAGENPEIWKERPVQFELLKHFGYFTTESSWHCSEYLPYYLPREDSRAAVNIPVRQTHAERREVAERWGPDSELVQQIDGRMPLKLTRTFEYGVHIIHALQSDAVYRMNLNVLNNGLLIENLPEETCVEVPCVVDRLGIHRNQVGNLPVQLAALSRGMADMQTLAADAFLEKDLNKAYMACAIDPTTAASATPAQIKACFQELLTLEQPWLESYWGKDVSL
jgi:alpha-galactosidase